MSILGILYSHLAARYGQVHLAHSRTDDIPQVYSKSPNDVLDGETHRVSPPEAGYRGPGPKNSNTGSNFDCHC